METNGVRIRRLIFATIPCKSSALEAESQNRMSEYGLKWCPTGLTRKTADEKGSAIDHAFVRNYGLERVEASCSSLVGISDHEMISVRLTEKILEVHSNQKNEVGFRINWQKFEAELTGADIRRILNESDPDSILDLTCDLLQKIKERASSTHVANRKTVPLKLWISEGALRSIRTRDKLWQKVKAAPNDMVARHKFNKYRNKLRDCLREAERRYLARSLRTAGNPKNSWRVINQYIRGRATREVYPSYLQGGDVARSDLNDSNVFFANIGKRACEDLGPVDVGSVGEFRSIDNPLRELPIPSLNDIEQIIDAQGEHKAPGRDMMTSKTLRCNKPFFIPVL